MKKTMKTKAEPQMTAAEYLKLPYMRAVVPDEDGTFTAEILEFEGCIATGDTRDEAMNSLEDVALAWLEGMIASGQHIPAPLDHTGYSGKFVVRMPRSLHRKAAVAAEREGVSLNQFIVSGVAESIGGRSSGEPAAPIAQVLILTHPAQQATARSVGRIRSEGYSWLAQAALPPTYPDLEREDA